MAASKMKTFGDGTPYVEAGGWAMCFAWILDWLVFAFGVAAGFVALAMVDSSQGLSGGAIVAGLLALFAGVPLLYGLCYGNGRGLGALWTGTRLVRLSDGGRIGAKGPWAMFVRVILLPLAILATLTGGGSPPGGLQRTSIDVAKTRRLQEERRAGYLPPRV